MSRFLPFLMFLGAISLAIACKSGGDGPEFFEVLRVSPEDQRTDVQVETRIGFEIDANIDPATLTSDTFIVTDPDGAQVQGELIVDPDDPGVAVLTPAEPLSVITEYTATITTGLTSTGGATLEESFEWRFTTLDSAWGTDDWLETIGTGNSNRPQIAVDAGSSALAIWEYEEGPGTRIWASHYTRVDLWEEPEPIDDGIEPPSNPRLAVDDAGNGFAVWEQQAAAALTNIWTNRYAVDQGWGTPALLQSVEITNARGPSVAAGPAGDATAVWIQQEMDSPNQVVWASRYEPGSGWGPAEPIDGSPTPSAGTRTRVGMDDEGNAIAIWARLTVPSAGGRGEVLWANRYVAGVGWGTAEVIKPDSETRARDGRLSVSANGDAFMVWVQNDPMRGSAPEELNDIWGVRFSGSGWEPPERIDDSALNKGQPDVAVDGAGVAHAVWSQEDADFRNIWASTYVPGSGWGAPELIEPPNEDPNEDGDATVPRISVNSAGNAFVVWAQVWEDWQSVWSNRRDPEPEETQWDPMRTELVEAAPRAARAPTIVADENRHAHAVWLHNLAQGRWVRTNRFE